MDVGVREPPTTGQSAYPSSVPCKPISHPRSNKYSFHNRSAELNSIILLHPPGQPFKMHTNTWHQNLLKSRVFLKCTTGLCLWNRKCPTPGCDGSGHVTGRFTAHHCISGCPLAERNQGRLKAELSDSECKRTLFFGQRTKKTHFRGRCVCVCVCWPTYACEFTFVSHWSFHLVFRIGRPPKFRKSQQRDYQSEFSKCMIHIRL